MTLSAQEQFSDAYMVPPKVYVGDRATFILPLPGQDDTETPIPIPSHDEIDIH
jgi:hypothetical protein